MYSVVIELVSNWGGPDVTFPTCVAVGYDALFKRVLCVTPLTAAGAVSSSECVPCVPAAAVPCVSVPLPGGRI